VMAPPAAAPPQSLVQRLLTKVDCEMFIVSVLFQGPVLPKREIAPPLTAVFPVNVQCIKLVVVDSSLP
jgi:hypothetical protein